MNTKMNVNLLRFLAFHQEDGRQAAGCEDGRGERMCLCVCMGVKVGGRKEVLWDQGRGNVAALGATGPEGAEASASLVMVMRRFCAAGVV